MGSSSLSRDGPQAPCIGSAESQPLDHQGSPSLDILECRSSSCSGLNQSQIWIPSYSSLACQQPSAQLSWSRVTTPKNRHNPSRWRTSCWLLSSSLTIHTMWQITRNANSWPIPNCLASLPAWVLGNLCATVQRRAVDLKQTAWYFSSKHRLIWDQLRIAIQGLQLTSLFFWWKSTVPAQC